MKGSYYRYSKLSLTWCSSCLCVKLLLGPSSGPEGDPVWLFCHSKQLIIWFNIFKRQSYSLEPCDQFAIWMFVASFSAEKAAFGFILTELNCEAIIISQSHLWSDFLLTGSECYISSDCCSKRFLNKRKNTFYCVFGFR